jgi:hypothetical protein
MIKNWNLFKESVDEKSKIHEICKKYNILNYTINDDLSIDVDSYVNLDSEELTEIPLKFGKVSGYFECDGNRLKSLGGCPKWIGGDFYCYDNNLTSLEFGPEYVVGHFSCRGKDKLPGKLTSLEYLPRYIGGYINCKYNKIWSFRGIPDSFRGDLYCNVNPIWNIWKLFESTKDIEFFNDCHIVREPETPDGLPIVVLERLNYFLDVIGKPTVQKVNGYINI